jgi:hypothetical protein
MRKVLPKTARAWRVISFTQCPRNCRCGRDPENGPYFVKRWREGGSSEETCVPWQEVAATFAALGRAQVEQPKPAESLPKRPVGSLHLEFKKCGRPNCRCRRGLLHGPFLYRHRRANGRQRKEYVPKKRLAGVVLEMEHQRGEVARPTEVRRRPPSDPSPKRPNCINGLAGVSSFYQGPGASPRSNETGRNPLLLIELVRRRTAAGRGFSQGFTRGSGATEEGGDRWPAPRRTRR